MFMQSLEARRILIAHSSFFPRQSSILNLCHLYIPECHFLSQYRIPCKVLGESQLVGRGKIPYSVDTFAFSRIPLNILGQIPDLKKILPDRFHGSDQFDLKSNFVSFFFKKEMSRDQSGEFISGHCGQSASVWTV